MKSMNAGRLTLLTFILVSVAGVLLRPATPVDETRYLAVAWEMWQSGDYLVPTKNFALYTHKPPLLFWAINLVWAVTGVSEIAARLVGPFFATLAIWLTGALARRLWPDDATSGDRAIMALVGLSVFALLGSMTMFDAMLTAATVAGVLVLLLASWTGQHRWWLLFGAAIAWGVLAKGPVILFHLLPVAALAPIWARDLRWSAAWTGIGLALLTAIALLGLWLVPAIISGGPEYRDAILWTQSAGRMSDSFAHARPWWFLFAMLPLLLFPWVFLPAIWRAAAHTDWRDPGLRLCTIWAISALVLFSLISAKQMHYLAPECAAMALILSRLTRGIPGFRTMWACLPIALIVVIATAAAAGLIDLGRADQLLQPTSVLLAWAFLAVALCWLAMRLGGLRGGAVLGLGLVLSLNLLIGLTATRDIYDTHRIARTLAPYQQAGIAFVGQSYHAEFNFAGRFTEPVALPQDAAMLAAWQAAHPGGVILARPQLVTLPWQPRTEFLFRNSPYAIWHVADAPDQEPIS